MNEVRIGKRRREELAAAVDKFAVGEWFDFLFEDAETGEVFLVEIKRQRNTGKTIGGAFSIASDNFKKPKCIGVYSSDDAEILGYDTY